MFGDVTQFKESESDVLSRLQPAPSDEGEEKPIDKMSNKDFRDDPAVREFTHPQGLPAVDQLLSPLKKALYMKATDNGSLPFKSGTSVELDGKQYKLYLTKEELEVLQPSVYLQSYRIKYSPKKAYIFLRLLRKMGLKEAITQCHFNNKKIAREIAPMLTKGIEHAKSLGLNEDNLYIQQIWVGKDGFFRKRLDFKGRGRTGIITHKYIHVKAILREKSFEKSLKEATKSRRDSRPVWQQLPNKPFVDNPQIQAYKW